MTDVAAPTSKRELLDGMAHARREFDEILGRIPRDRFLEPGRWGEWTLKDLVAHVAAYERWTAQQLVNEPSAEQKAEAEQVAGEGVDALNRMIYETHRDDPLDEVLAESAAAHRALCEAVESLTEEQLASPMWMTGGRTLFEMIPDQSDVHYADHLDDLRRAAEEETRG